MPSLLSEIGDVLRGMYTLIKVMAVGAAVVAVGVVVLVAKTAGYL